MVHIVKIEFVLFLIFANNVISVRDKEKVYAAIMMSETDNDLENNVGKIYQKLSPKRKQLVTDIVNLLFWLE